MYSFSEVTAPVANTVPGGPVLDTDTSPLGGDDSPLIDGDAYPLNNAIPDKEPTTVANQPTAGDVSDDGQSTLPPANDDTQCLMDRSVHRHLP